MKPSFALTGSDLVRALGHAVALPAVDDAVRRRADEIARTVAGDGLVTRVLRRDAGDYVVSVEGPNLFAREYGAVDRPANPMVADTLRSSLRKQGSRATGAEPASSGSLLTQGRAGGGES